MVYQMLLIILFTLKRWQSSQAIFSTAVGLVEYGARYHKNSGEKSKDVVGDFINKIKRFFEWF